MARDILITPYKDSAAAGEFPKIEFQGKDAATVTLDVQDDGTVRLIDGSSANIISFDGDNVTLGKNADMAGYRVLGQPSDYGQTSYRFDGVDDEIQIASSAHTNFGSGDFTIYSRFYMSSLQENRIVSRDDRTSIRQYWIGVDANGDLFAQARTDGSNYLGGRVSTSISAGQWYDVVMVIDVSTPSMSLYINGISQTIENESAGTYTGLAANNQEVNIGARDNTDKFHDGEISDVILFNRALTQSEVEALSKGAPVSFADKGASQTNQATGDDSDFDTLGSWTAYNVWLATIVGDWNGGAGTGFVKVYNSSISLGGLRHNTIVPTKGKNYLVRLKAKLLSGSSTTVYIGAYHVSAPFTNTFTITPTGTETTYTGILENYPSNRLDIYASSADAVFIYDDFELIQIGAVAECPQSGIGASTWKDMSGNGLDGTVTGASVMNYRGIHSDGTDIFADNNAGIGTSTIVERLTLGGTNPRIYMPDATAPGTTTNRLYSVSGVLYWDGVNLSGSGAGTLPTGTEGQTLRNESGTWEATSSLTIDDSGNVASTGNITAGGDIYIDNTTPKLVFKDSSCTDADENAIISVGATNTGSGTEDIDMVFYQQIAGVSTLWLQADADGNINFGTGRPLVADGGGSLTGTWSDLGTVSTVDIDGGTIDGVTIGGSSAGAITGTTITANTGLTIGSGGAGVDYVLTFDGETNDGTITYMEDEDRFDFGSAVNVQAAPGGTAQIFSVIGTGTNSAYMAFVDEGVKEWNVGMDNGSTSLFFREDHTGGAIALELTDTSDGSFKNDLDVVGALTAGSFVSDATIEATTTMKVGTNMGVGTDANAIYTAYFNRAFTGTGGTGRSLFLNDVISAGANEGIELIRTTGSITANSGTHGIIASAALNGVAISGTATITNLANLYINAAHTYTGGTVTNGPYSIFVDDGESRFDGDVTVGGTLSVSDNNITNVGDISLDSITSDGSSITIGGTPSIVLTDNTTIAVTLGNDAGDDFTIDSTAFVVEGDSGNVGIGTSSPGSILHILGSTADESLLKVEGTNGVLFEIFDTVTGTLFAVNDGSGIPILQVDADDTVLLAPYSATPLVGIGTSSPSVTLDILGTGRIGNLGNTISTPSVRLSGVGIYNADTNYYGNYGGLLFNADTAWTSSARRYLITNAFNTNMFAIIRSTDASTDPSLGTNGVVSSGTIDFVIGNTGNVGIGTTSLGYKLSLLDNSSGTDDIDYLLNIKRTSTGTPTAGFGTGIRFEMEDLAGNENREAGKIETVWESGGNYESNMRFYTRTSTGTTERMRIDSSGNVGIGTTSPDRLFHISANVPTFIIDNADGTADQKMRYITSDGGALVFGKFSDALSATEHMRIDSSGNVGIGTTSPAGQLDVTNPSGSGSDTLGTGTINFGIVNDDFWAFRQSATALSDLAIDRKFAGNWAEVLRIQRSSGNVGIGTTSPVSNLDVMDATGGVISVTRDDNGVVDGDLFGKFQATGNDGSWSQSDIAGSIQWIANGGQTQSRPKANMIFKVADGSTTEETAMTIQSDRKVGIGTTEPATALEVVGTSGLRLTQTAGSGQQIRLGSTGAVAYIDVLSGSTTGEFQFRTGEANANAVRIDKSGNVGIGTTSPQNILNVEGTASNDNEGITISNSNNGYSGSLTFATEYSGVDKDVVRIRASTDGANGGTLSLMTGDSSNVLQNRITIKKDGKVGIGTTSPSEELGVRGEIGVEDTNGDEIAKIGGDTTGGVLIARDTNGTADVVLDARSTNPSYFNNGGNVGIGTTTPSALLDLVGSQPSSVGTTPGTAATDVLEITGGAGGDTSIGTTGVGGIGADLLLTGGVGGEATAATTASTGGKGGSLTLTGGAGGVADVGGTTNVGGDGGDITLNPGAGGAASGATSNTAGSYGNVLIATTGGSVGIGTTSLSRTLNVVSSSHAGLNIESTGEFALLELNRFDTSKDSYIAFQTGGASNWIVGTGRTGSESKLSFETGGARTLILDGTKVGIGIDAPTYTLDVAGNIGLDEYLYHNDDTDTYLRFEDNQLTAVVEGGHTSTGSSISLANDGSQELNASQYIRFQTGGANERIRILADGKVGINTDNPTYQLQVDVSNTTSYADTGSGGAGIRILNSVATTNSPYAQLAFQIVNTESGTKNAVGYINLVQESYGAHGATFTFQLREDDGTYDEFFRLNSDVADHTTAVISSQNYNTGLTITGYGSSYTDTALVLAGTSTSNGRGAGIYMHDTLTDKEWFAGRLYYNTTNGNDWWGVSRKISVTAHATSTADQTNKLMWITSAGALNVTGDITGNTSDARLKTNLNPIQNPMDKIRALNSYTFNWDLEATRKAGYSPPTSYNEQLGDIGVLAQDVQRVLPQAVRLAPFDTDGHGRHQTSVSGDNYLTVKYDMLSVLLLAGIKEQDQTIQAYGDQIQSHEDRLNELEDEIRRLKAKLTDLE